MLMIVLNINIFKYYLNIFKLLFLKILLSKNIEIIIFLNKKLKIYFKYIFPIHWLERYYIIAISIQHIVASI